jgi:hypothetical protein
MRCRRGCARILSLQPVDMDQQAPVTGQADVAIARTPAMKGDVASC